MLTIHWLWLPLIITVGLCLIAWVCDGFKPYVNSAGGAVFGILTSFSFAISFLIYLFAGIVWLYNHINITS